MLKTGTPFRHALLLVLAACAASRGAPAGSGLELEGQYFRDRNGVWVYTGLLAFKRALARKLGLDWTQTYDIMSGASRSLGASRVGHADSLRSVDAVTRASARESRHAARAALTLGDGDAGLTGSLYASREDDYLSLAPGAGLFRRFNRGNSTVSLDFSWHLDRSRPAAPFRDLGGRKLVTALDVSGTQVLTPLLLVAAGGTVTTSRGRLGHPYTPTILADGGLLDESLPGRRMGASIFLQALQGFPAAGRLGAIDLKVQRYQDDWGLISHAADLKWTRNLPAGIFYRLRLRGYGQDGALFTRKPYRGDERYHSSDVRLHAFRSLLLGLKLGGALPEPWEDSPLLPDAWDLTYERSFRNTRGDRPGAPQTYQLHAPDGIYLQDVLRLGLRFAL